MLRKLSSQWFWLGLLSIGCLAFAGCRQSGSCRNGSCSVPLSGYGSSQSYAQPSYQGSGSSQPVQSYAAPAPAQSYSAPSQSYTAPSQSYTAPGGSGSRSAPTYGGSGSR